MLGLNNDVKLSRPPFCWPTRLLHARSSCDQPKSGTARLIDVTRLDDRFHETCVVEQMIG